MAYPTDPQVLVGEFARLVGGFSVEEFLQVIDFCTSIVQGRKPEDEDEIDNMYNIASKGYDPVRALVWLIGHVPVPKTHLLSQSVQEALQARANIAKDWGRDTCETAEPDEPEGVLANRIKRELVVDEDTEFSTEKWIRPLEQGEEAVEAFERECLTDFSVKCFGNDEAVEAFERECLTESSTIPPVADEDASYNTFVRV